VGGLGLGLPHLKVRDNTRNMAIPVVTPPTGGSFVLPIMNDATLRQIAAAKVTDTKGSHVWISNHI
jgi:hypothetical protein